MRVEGEEGCLQGVVRERDNLQDIGVDGAILLKRIVMKWDVIWTGLSWFRYGQVADLYLHGKEFCVHKIIEVSWVVEGIWASREGITLQGVRYYVSYLICQVAGSNSGWILMLTGFFKLPCIISQIVTYVTLRSFAIFHSPVLRLCT